MKWLAAFEENGEVLFRIGRADDDNNTVVAEWPGRARLEARRDGSAYHFQPQEGAHPLDIAKLERGGVQLLLRHLRGQLSFHGAAVARGDEAVILLGRAGDGKSTLAAALCSYQGAVALLADDAVFLDATEPSGYVVTSLEEDHWLKRETYEIFARSAAPTEPWSDNDQGAEDKRPLRAPRSTSRAKLKALISLSFDDQLAEPVCKGLSPIGAMAALVPQAVRFVFDEAETNRRELEQLAAIVESVPIVELRRPRDLGLLSQTCEQVLKVIDS